MISVSLARSLRDLCSCSCVSLQCKSAGPVSDELQGASKPGPHWSPRRHPVTELWGLFCPGQGEVWAVFRAVAADGGRRQLLTIALSVNLGTAVLKTLLVSFDLRPPTDKLWLPSSCQVVFKPSSIAVRCAFWYLSQHIQF